MRARPEVWRHTAYNLRRPRSSYAVTCCLLPARDCSEAIAALSEHGAASETPRRFPDLGAAAVGQRLEQDIIRAVADRYAERIDTLSDTRGSAWYRTEMVRVWVRRAVEHARDGHGVQA
jgi:CO/xanthine dehydrogenase FAD-binding subunit